MDGAWSSQAAACSSVGSSTVRTGIDAWRRVFGRRLPSIGEALFVSTGRPYDFADFICLKWMRWKLVRRVSSIRMGVSSTPSNRARGSNVL